MSVETLKTLGRQGLNAFCKRWPLPGRGRAVSWVGPYLIPGRCFDIQRVGGAAMTLDLSDVMERFMYYGLYEEAEANWVRTLVKPEDVVVDIGANIGYFTLMMAGLVGAGGQVHAFEPVPSSWQRLSDAVDTNRLRNVFVNKLAVGRDDGTLPLYPNADVDASLRMASAFAGGSGKPITVGLTRLDSYLSQRNIPRVDFVKIDIEGAEFDALLGMKELLARRQVRAILSEIWPLASHRLYHTGTTSGSEVADSEIEAYLAGFGYHSRVVTVGSDGVKNVLFSLS